MDICDEINKAKLASSRIAESFAVNATFGNNTEEDLFKLVQINALIRTMERNQTTHKHIKATASLLQGQTVPLSSLKKQNNTLILDLSEPPCLEIEIRPCLSDIEICKIAETAQLISYKV
jgi:hypothetical protein